MGFMMSADITPLRPHARYTPIGVDMETGYVLFEDGTNVRPVCIFDENGAPTDDMDGATLVICDAFGTRWIIDLESFEGRALQ